MLVLVSFHYFLFFFFMEKIFASFLIRLRNAWECPSNGSHFEECNCEDEDNRMSGGSYFSKVRLDLSSMRIISKSLSTANKL